MLLIFGLVQALLVFPGEMLVSYGLMTLLTGWLLSRFLPVGGSILQYMGRCR